MLRDWWWQFVEASFRVICDHSHEIGNPHAVTLKCDRLFARPTDNYPLEITIAVTPIAEWLACWTQAQKGLGSNRSRDATLSGNSPRQTVHTHRSSVHQTAKLVAALLRVAGVTAGLAESNGSLLPGLWRTSPAGWLPRTGISSGTVRSVIEYRLPSPFIPDPG